MEIYLKQLHLLVWKDPHYTENLNNWYNRRLKKMKVIICGAGKVGTSIAKHLVSQKNDVTVIDQSLERLMI